MKHIAEQVNYAQLIGTPISTDLIEKLNLSLSTCQMRALTASKHNEDGKRFTVYLEGVIQGAEFTPFTLGIAGTPDTIRNGLMSITKSFFRTIPDNSDRDELEKFFRTRIIPQFC